MNKRPSEMNSADDLERLADACGNAHLEWALNSGAYAMRQAEAGKQLRNHVYGIMTIYHGFLPEHFRSDLYLAIKSYDDAMKAAP